MNLKKIVGSILLISGVLIIFWTIYSSYNIFTAKSDIPEMFKIEEETTLLKEKVKIQDTQEQMAEAISEQIEKIIPKDVKAKILNLISWSIFAYILIFAGAQITSIGIKLISKD